MSARADSKAGERWGWRLKELERKAREDVERVLKTGEGNSSAV